MVVTLDISLKYVKSSAIKYNVKNVDCSKFDEIMTSKSKALSVELDGELNPVNAHDCLMDEIRKAVVICGTYLPSGLPGKRNCDHCGGTLSVKRPLTEEQLLGGSFWLVIRFQCRRNLKGWTI